MEQRATAGAHAGLVAPGSGAEGAPAGHGTAAPAGSVSRIGRLRPDLLVRSQRPGIVPLARLRLGDVVDGSLRMLRRNPQATLGISLVVCGLVMAPSLATVGVLGAMNLVAEGDLQVVSAILPTVGLGVGTAMLLGFVAVVTHEATLGRRVSAQACLEHVRRRGWALLGTALLTLLAVAASTSLLVVPLTVLGFSLKGNAGAAILAVTWIAAPALAAALAPRVVLAPAVCVLEGRGPGGSLARAWRLTRGFVVPMRLLGWLVVAGLLCGVAVSLALLGIVIFALAMSQLVLADAMTPSWLRDALATVAPHAAMLLAATLSTPYLAGVICLFYLDRRFELEGYDVTLVRRFQDEAALVTRR